MQSLLTGRDVLAALPTGAGKSPVLQSPRRPAFETEDVIDRRRGRIRLLGSGCDPDAISLEARERRRAYETSRGGLCVDTPRV